MIINQLFDFFPCAVFLLSDTPPKDIKEGTPSKLAAQGPLGKDDTPTTPVAPIQNLSSGELSADSVVKAGNF
jgi:hypothetical protein